MTRDWKIGICGVGFLALSLLAYALFGRPPYRFFTLLRWTVAVSSGLGAWALLQSEQTLPPNLVMPSAARRNSSVRQDEEIRVGTV